MTTDSATIDTYFTETEISNVRKSLNEASVIPTFCYSDQGYHEKEVEEVLMRSWLPAGRVSQLENAGDYFTRDYFGESVVFVRGTDGEIRALSNVCRHRATQILDNGSGNEKLLICPYHRWAYNLKYRKYKWGVESSWSSRKWSWRHEIMDASSESACG